jgi:hypothetical protein
MPGGSPEGDWIERYLDYTSKLPTPRIFRLWAGISAVAGALERRVSIRTVAGDTFPNLFIFLVAPPAVGKSQAMTPARDLWRGTKRLFVAPNSVTKASMLDNLVSSSRKIIINGGAGLYEYNCLNIASSELGVLLPAHDTDFMSTMIDIYDNPPIFEETRRHSTSVSIPNPQMNLIAGAQPGFLSGLLPEEAWSMGFMSRVIMVYAGSGPEVDLFDMPEEDKEGWKELLAPMTKMADSKLMGRCSWEDEAIAEVRRWLSAKLEPVPEHSKLQYYCGRRKLLFLKLIIVSTVSRSMGTHITLFDVNRARDWLLDVELRMPDVFKEMTNKSDSSVLQELHYFAWKLWIKEKKPVHESRLLNFLQDKAPSDRCFRILEMADRMQMIVRQAGSGTYVPRPKHEHNAE